MMRDLLPPDLQIEPVTPVGGGQSGAGVYAVGKHHILKVSPAPKLATLRAAAAAGLAPRIVHVDEARGAVVPARVVGVSFPALMAHDAQQELATAAVFLRLSDAGCRALCAAHGNVSFDDRFRYERRLVAALCGALFLSLAKQPFDDPGLKLGACYQQLRAGTLVMSSPEGRWTFGLALLRAAGS